MSCAGKKVLAFFHHMAAPVLVSYEFERSYSADVIVHIDDFISRFYLFYELPNSFIVETNRNIFNLFENNDWFYCPFVIVCWVYEGLSVNMNRFE